MQLTLMRPFSWQLYVEILVGDRDRDIEEFAAPLNGRQQAHPIRRFPYLCRLVGAHTAADVGDAVGCSISSTSGKATEKTHLHHQNLLLVEQQPQREYHFSL